MKNNDAKKLLNECLDIISVDIKRLKTKSDSEALELKDGHLLTDYIKVLAQLEKDRIIYDLDDISNLSTEELTARARKLLRQKDSKYKV